VLINLRIGSKRSCCDFPWVGSVCIPPPKLPLHPHHAHDAGGMVMLYWQLEWCISVDFLLICPLISLDDIIRSLCNKLQKRLAWRGLSHGSHWLWVSLLRYIGSRFWSVVFGFSKYFLHLRPDINAWCQCVSLLVFWRGGRLKERLPFVIVASSNFDMALYCLF
jgi:hypothetical protein